MGRPPPCSRQFAIGPGSLRTHMAALQERAKTARRAAGAGGRARRRSRRPHRARASRRVRSGHRSRRGSAPAPADPRAPAQAPPAACGRAWRGQDRDRRRAGARIAAGDVPENLSKLALLELEMGALMAGAKLRGEIEERLRRTLADVRTAGARRLHSLHLRSRRALRAGRRRAAGWATCSSRCSRAGRAPAGNDDARGDPQDPGEGPALPSALQVLDIEAPTPDQAIEILRGVATRYEAHHRVQIGDPAIVRPCAWRSAISSDRALPDWRSISSTRPRPENASSSTASPPTSTWPSGAWRR